ncbi:MAG: glutathione S-transferase family protein [Hyphomicrobiales bacterium]|nr:glutathione S-transferase family protein [Hyphomicrobiales bacterium]
MLTLYHCISARSFRPLWTLEEMGLDYKLVMLPFPPRVFAKAYKEINPLGTIPTFFDGDMRMTESSGICHYLATKHGPTPLAVDVADPEYGTWLNWLYFSDATLTFPQTLYLRYTRLEPPESRQPKVADDYKKWFLGRLRFVETTLADRDYLAAGRFTIADIAVGFGLMLAEILELSPEFGPNVSAYWARLKARPGFKKAIAAQDKGLAEMKGPTGVMV